MILLAGCSSPSPIRNILIASEDAGVDATADAALDAGVDAAAATDASDAGAYLGGACVDDAQCDDGIACTFDACDPTLLRCRNTPDDTQCDDGKYCDGREVCVPAHGCEAGDVVTCDDGNECTIDACVEATMSCVHAPRDLDQDGDPDAHCDPGHDCNDLDPTVASTLPEICANGVDDNCNGVIDEMPCVAAANTTCGTALAITATGTYALSTTGTNDAYATSCDVSAASAARQVIATVTIPAGGPMDLDLTATTNGSEVAITLQSSCGDPTTELTCEAAKGATSIRAIGRSLVPGTYAVIVTTAGESDVQLAVAIDPPTPKPTNEDCASAAPIAIGTPTDVSLIDASKDLASACTSATGELTYTFTLAATADVTVFASTVSGSGEPVIELRDADCVAPTDEISCRSGGSVFERSLAPGKYVVAVAATSPIDATLLVTTSAPTVAPPNQSCATAPAITTGTDTAIDLTSHEDAIKDGCSAGFPDGALDLNLASASDVLVVARFPENEVGAVSIDDPTCTPALYACGFGSTPVRASKENLAAGDYRVVVADQFGEMDEVTALVRPAEAPYEITNSDTCATALILPPTGGLFLGNTSASMSGFNVGCDTPVAATMGEREQIMELTLTESHRVVFDMSGSSYATILDIFTGTTCPGTEVPNACYVGYSAQRSFLDITLPAATYWIVVSGYNGAFGAWNLNMFVL